MKIRINGAYSDGHEHDTEQEIAEFDYAIHGDEDEDFGDKEEALSNYLFQFTGDGHGIKNHRLHYYCEITILDAVDLDLIGQKFDYDG